MAAPLPSFLVKGRGRFDDRSWSSSSSYGGWKGKGYGKGKRPYYRPAPYQGKGQANSLGDTVANSFQRAVGATVEHMISEGFSVLASRLCSASAAEPVPQQPKLVETTNSARAGSALAKAGVSIFGRGTGSDTTSEPKAPDPVCPNTASELQEKDRLLQQALEQQTKTLAVVAELAQTCHRADREAREVSMPAEPEADASQAAQIKALKAQLDEITKLPHAQREQTYDSYSSAQCRY